MTCRSRITAATLSSGAIPSSCKVLFRCDETSGYPVNAVNGAVYNPNNLVVAGNPGSVAYEVANAIRFNLATDGVSVSIPLDVTCSTRNVLILAAHILPIETLDSEGSPAGYSGTRVAVGTLGSAATGDSPVLSVSFSAQQHTQFDVTGTGGANYQVSAAPAVGFSLADYTPQTIYVVWNGLGSSGAVNGTLTSKCLNANGTVKTVTLLGTPYELVQTASGIIIPDTVTLGNMMRPAWAHYYKMEMWELPYLPANLDAKLAVWGDLARAGRKEAFYL